MGDRCGVPALRRRCVQVCALTVLVLAGCATVPQEEHQSALDRISLLESELEALEQELAEREEAIERAEAAANDQEAAAAQAEADLAIALAQLGTLREERQELLDTVATLEETVQSGGAQSIASVLLQDEAAADEARGREPESALAEALAGRGGFLRADELGLRNMPRIASRYASAAPGIAADLEFGTPRLFDGRLDYEDTAIFLTITDPAGNRPRLTLTAQYVTDEVPLYIRSVFISIEGRDPVDPVDPIVLTTEPTRRTDGERLLESISTEVTGTLADRLTAMVSSNRFTVTFVGIGAQSTHRPSVSERSALSNMLFAWFDLAGRAR